MIETIHLSDRVVLRHCPDDRFKKGALSVQLLRPMCREEAANNALLVSVLLRGTKDCPDLRSITWRLDELYGAAVSTLVRRIGDVQTVGFYMSFIEDRFAMPGDQVLAPTIDFMRQLFLEPVTVNGAFDPEFVESEKKNLISAIDSERNDKRTYAAARMLRYMCQGDSFAEPRIGRREDVAAITAQSLYAHYQKILRTSPVEIFYAGSASAQEVARLLSPLADALGAEAEPVPAQTMFTPTAEPREFSETLDVNQGKLCMGFTTPISNQHPDFVAMQVFNTVYGGGMTSKLFLNVREKMSLCYYANSGYYGSKGIVTVSSGIDEENYETAKSEILHQLELCLQGQITPEELNSAKKALISSLRSIPDSPGSLEGFYATAAVSGMKLDIPDYIEAAEAVTAADVARCASTVKLHTTFFLKGVSV